MAGKESLVKADVRLRCADSKHKKMCGELRDALLDKFNNIQEAETTKAFGTSEDYCVIATATINPKNKTKFVNALKELHGTSRASKVDAVKVEIIQ